MQIEPQFGFSYTDILAIGNAGEKAGFTRLWLSDHLFLNADAVRTDCLEAWTALAAMGIWFVLVFAFDAFALGLGTAANVGISFFAAFMLATLTVTGRHMMFRLTREEDDGR